MARPVLVSKELLPRSARLAEHDILWNCHFDKRKSVCLCLIWRRESCSGGGGECGLWEGVFMGEDRHGSEHFAKSEWKRVF